jgi:hypothetical protein
MRGIALGLLGLMLVVAARDGVLALGIASLGLGAAAGAVAWRVRQALRHGQVEQQVM